MSIFEKVQEIFNKKNIVGNYFKDFLTFFLCYFAKVVASDKIKSYRHIIALSYDTFSIIIAWFSVYWILGNATSDTAIISNLFWLLPSQFLLYRFFGLYRGFWRFASIQDLRKILTVSILGGLIVWFVLRNPLNLSIAFLYCIFLSCFLSFPRLFVRFAKDYKHRHGEYQRVIIVGAGNAGEGLVRDLLRDSSHRFKPIAFVDDNLQKFNREIHNVRVVGAITDLPKLIVKYNIDLVLIAIPSASSTNMRSVVNMCEKAKVRCYTLPSIKDLANGNVSINVLRSISLEDLLGRYPVMCEWSSTQAHMQGKTILITGGGGSIGSELCRQVVSLGSANRLVIVDSNEYNLYAIEMELRQRFPACEFYPVLLSVTDRIGIQAIFKKYQPQVVFHAAAYKHVPMLEYQPRVAMYNNIIGTCILAEEALHANIETFILISSDKAVNPTNIMGATKRAAEYFCQNLNDSAQKTRFITVRFGNVLDSAGSVIPLFRKQIEAGGPVTVTHPDITRFFMTIPEASQLILQASFLGKSNEIFVLDMGDPIKISYLAEQMIKLAGKVVDQDVKILYTGLRPGEKLYEEFFYSNETLQPTTHKKILRAKSQRRNFDEIHDICRQIKMACELENTEKDELIKLLEKLVPEYQVFTKNTPNDITENLSYGISLVG